MNDMNYKVFDDGIFSGIIRLSDNALVPIDENNSDYRAYLQWIAEGNTALPAD